MRVLYLLPILPPKIPQAEALSQEIELLRIRHPGPIVHINPNRSSRGFALGLRIPRLLFGWHRLQALWELEQTVDVVHFYNPDPYPFPILRWLRKPVVYSITGGVTSSPNTAFFSRMGALTTLSASDQRMLHDAGLQRVFLVRPSVDVSRFTRRSTPLLPDGSIHLLMASAPWTLGQFASKGIDALLAAARLNPKLHLTLLWRGMLLNEVQRRIAAAGVSQRVTVVDGLVDVNAALAEAHAAIVLAADAQIIKAYPQSLLDALAAGKPVLVSRVIPFAQYVEQTACGQVVEAVTAQSILAAVQALAADYDRLARNASAATQADFAPEATIASFTRAYECAINHGTAQRGAASRPVP